MWVNSSDELLSDNPILFSQVSPKSGIFMMLLNK